ncbi:sulfurtransferase [Thalassotalea atypica]|uniref:sulfurtransferase n=1 Tax=Thalassotalea atypica TaxID=2054316 RepID=UPI002572DD3C|nr:sulfurtransferase [Thalassotalea atypica]
MPAKPPSLISVSVLFQQLNNPSLIILDASIAPVGKMATPRAAWPEVSIPNARRFDIEGDFSDQCSQLPHTLPAPAQLKHACQKLGINKDSFVVVYDSYGIFSSARAWYMLKAMGLKHVEVLNGGLPEWLNQGYETTNAVLNSNWPLGNFTPSFDSRFFCNADYVQDNLNNDDVKVLDARAFERFAGQTAEPREGVRSGHIPNALNLPYNHLIVNGHLKDLASLKNAFDEKSIVAEDTLIMSCGSGITACILALAAQIVGYENITVYDGSWSEWGSAHNRPIEISK